MGDVRFQGLINSVLNATDRAAVIRNLSDEDVIAALAAASGTGKDPYLLNVLATEGMNRVRRLSAVAHHLGEGVFAVDTLGQVRFVNPAGERLLGWTEGELTGRRAHDALHAAAGEDEACGGADACRLLRVLETGGSDHAEDAFTRKDGTCFPVERTIAPVVNDDEVTGAVVVFRDITERQRLQTALRESEELFRATFAEAGMGIAIVTMDGRLVHTNAALQTMLAYSEEEFQWLLFPEITHPDDVENDAREWRELTEGERAQYRTEKRYVRRDGTLVNGSLTVSVVRNPDGAPRFAVCMIEDVTRRKRAEEAKEEANRRVLAILDDMTDAFLALNEDGLIVQVNREAERILQRERSDLFGRAPAEVLPGAAGSRLGEALKVAAVDREPRHFEARSEVHDALLEFHAYASADGGFTVYFRDATSRTRPQTGS